MAPAKQPLKEDQPPSLLRELRGKQTVEAVANSIGITRLTWSRAEKGLKISKTTATRIASYFELDIEKLKDLIDETAAIRGAAGGAASRGKPKTFRKDKSLPGFLESFEEATVEYRLLHNQPVSVEEVVNRVAYLKLNSRTNSDTSTIEWLLSHLQIKKIRTRI